MPSPFFYVEGQGVIGTKLQSLWQEAGIENTRRGVVPTSVHSDAIQISD